MEMVTEIIKKGKEMEKVISGWKRMVRICD